MQRRSCLGAALVALAALALGCSDDSAQPTLDSNLPVDASREVGIGDLGVSDTAPNGETQLADGASEDAAADSTASDAGPCVDAGVYTPREHRTFEGGSVGELADGDATGFDGLLGGVDHVEFSDAFAASGTRAARFFMQASTTGDQGAVIRFSSPVSKGELWIRAYAYFPSGYAFVPNTEGQKFLRADMRSAAGVYRGAWDYYIGSNGTYLATGITAGDVARDFYAIHCAYADGNPCRGIGPDVTRGAWHYYEYYLKLSEVTAEGIIRAWVDGELHYEATGVKTLPDATDEIFQLKIFSGPQPGVYSQDQYAYVDEVLIASDASPPTNSDLEGNAMIGPVCAP